MVEEFEIDGHIVQLVYLEVPPKTSFSGQKLLHPFKTKMIPGYKHGAMYYEFEFESEEIANILKNTEIYGLKHDGACGALVWNKVTNQYDPYARYDIKRDPIYNFDKPLENAKWIPCEQKPDDPRATHWPHFRPCDEDVKMYKWYLSAYDRAKDAIDTILPEIFGEIVTVEFMGKKINGKDDIELDAGIVIHNTIMIDIPPELRTPIGYYNILKTIPIEGIVAYPKDHAPFKIRKDLFEGLKWGEKGKEGLNLSKYTVL